jgi:multidrug resistance efflux pump
MAIITLATQLPARRNNLVIRPIGERGRYVVKVSGTQNYYHLGEEEHFLLLQLDGKRDAATVCAAFETKFGEPLTEEDLDGFLEMARGQGLLENAEGGETSAESKRVDNTPHSDPLTLGSKQSISYWRKSVFNPDRFFDWLEPKIRFCWTRGFLIVSAGCIVLATLVLWSSRADAVTSFQHALRWETVVLAWLMMFAVGMLHESAHGLTCKHYAGEVREIGFLLMFFMPCFYCNVSDAWLFREKSKRLWVTLAGGYFELFLWALAVFVWRVTMPGTVVNYLAFIVLSLSGIDSFFNFNPLIKLDGYYLLSDWLEIPNLRQRSFNHLMERLRWLLWGASRPQRAERGGVLLGFGAASWLYSLMFVTLMIAGLHHWLSGSVGVLALPIVGVLGVVSARGLLGNLFREEFLKMFWQRHLRTLVWTMLLAGIVVGSFLVPWTDHASGDFEIRAKTHAELRAPVAGFLQHVHYDEGQQVSQGCELAQLAIPDLASRIARKQAELHEAEAKLRLLQAGPRAEEIAQQQRCVEAAGAWRDVAARNLGRQRQALEQELIRFDQMLKEYHAECAYAQQVLARHEKLHSTNTISEDKYAARKKAYLVVCAKREQTELAEREKELAHEQATLALLQAGTRPEDIEAGQATVERLREEAAYLNDVSRRLSIQSPVGGVITTGRLQEKVGDYFEEGELICEVEDAQQLEIVISLDEDRAARIHARQKVRLKARSLPFEVFEVEVERIAPRADKGDVQSQVNIYCRMDDPDGKLRSGMTGYARIQCRQAPLAAVFGEKCLRFIRTEFWW